MQYVAPELFWVLRLRFLHEFSVSFPLELRDLTGLFLILPLAHRVDRSEMKVTY